MPDNRGKRPLPAVMDVGTFRERFGTDAACWEHLRNIRWGPNLERFVCPGCGHARGWWLANRRLVECSECYRQTSVTAGTAWLMLLKLRRAMRRRNERDVLQGLAEVDETHVGGEEPGHPGRPGRDWEKKVPVAVALELNDEGKPRWVAMASVKRVTGHHLKRFAAKAIAKGSRLRTDGWGAYRVVAKAGYEHEPIITGSGRKAVQTLPWIHTFMGNMKRTILGTHHWVSRKHVDDYLAEFTYRTNRRWLEANLFDRLVVAALDTNMTALLCFARGGFSRPGLSFSAFV